MSQYIIPKKTEEGARVKVGVDCAYVGQAAQLLTCCDLFFRVRGGGSCDSGDDRVDSVSVRALVLER